MLKLQPITPACVTTFKAVRLRALQDSPTAFGSTYAGESQFSDDQWQQRAHKLSGEQSAGFLAFDGEEPCGIAVTYLDNEDAAIAHLVSMWVAPSHRQRGVGRMLVNTVIDWARSRQADALHLMVTSSNDAAMQFYLRLGFGKTGRTEPYPNDVLLIEYEMARRLVI